MKARETRITRRAAEPAKTADAVELPAADVADAGDGVTEETTEETTGAADNQAAPRADALGRDDSARAGLTRIGFAPITRVDTARREVELCATSEAVDSHGTVFDYAASKDAFTRWIGNVREMHERRAVGRRVSVRCDDEARKVFVRVRISRGAEDTWEKVVDGTLRGASIGAANVVWARQRRAVAGEPRWLEVATRYDLAELSLVDNPSNPDALGVSFVRDAVPDLALLDALEEDPAEDELATGTAVLTTAVEATAARANSDVRADTIERAQGPFSASAEGAPDMGVPARAEERPTVALGLGDAPAGNAHERFHAAARAILLGCGCLECVAALAALGDAATVDSAANRTADPAITGMREAALVRMMAAGLSASAARLAVVDDGLRELRGVVASLAGTVVASVADSVADSVAGRVAGALGDVRARLESLEAQPLPGGPVALPVARPVEKSHALLPSASAGVVNRAEQLRALESLAGRLADPQAQIAVAAEMIRLRDGA